jgi:Glycosyl hydrolases family 31
VLCRARQPLYGKSSCYSSSKLIVLYPDEYQTCQWVVGVQHPQHLWNDDVRSDARSLAGPSSGKRTFVITRSAFVGAGAHVGKWLGDNLSLWDHYRFSIAGMLGFGSIYQVPVVRSDICVLGMFSLVRFILEIDEASSLIRWKHYREFVHSLGYVGRVLSFHA